jgi:hypothetical protein
MKTVDGRGDHSVVIASRLEGVVGDLERQFLDTWLGLMQSMAGEHVGHDFGDVVEASREPQMWGLERVHARNRIRIVIIGGLQRGDSARRGSEKTTGLAPSWRVRSLAQEWRPTHGGIRKCRLFSRSGSNADYPEPTRKYVQDARGNQSPCCEISRS